MCKTYNIHNIICFRNLITNMHVAFRARRSGIAAHVVVMAFAFEFVEDDVYHVLQVVRLRCVVVLTCRALPKEALCLLYRSDNILVSPNGNVI